MPPPTDTMTAGTPCVADEASLPDDAFTSLRYHFGMLLGVDDFTTEQRYHRGKMRLHNAWLHRAGVVWGLEVVPALDERELRVTPGLALDPSGRELHLDVLSCLDVAAWFDEHEDGVETTKPAEGAVEFEAHVELAFCTCATRQVPAIADPCEGADTDTAYSRTFETVEIRLVPGLAPAPPVPYPRLRLLFGLEEDPPPELAERDEIVAARGDTANLLANFRRFANLDAIDMASALTPDGEHAVPFPFRDDEPLVLANVVLRLDGAGDARKLTRADVDLGPRRSHVATATIQELLCRGGVGSGGGGSGGVGGGTSTATAGARAVSAKLDRGAKTIVLAVDKPLAPGSLGAAFRISFFGDASWRPIKISGHPDLSADGKTVTLKFRAEPGDDVVRFLVRGTGQTPLLGDDGIPFAGGPESPPGTEHDGNDYVQMFKP